MDIHTTIIHGRFLLNLMVIALGFMSITVGISKQMVATQASSSRNTVVIGSTTFTLTEEVSQCMQLMAMAGPIPNRGAFMKKCLEDQRTTTSAPGQPIFDDPKGRTIRVSEGESVVLSCIVIDRGDHSVDWVKQATEGNPSKTLYDFNGKAGTIDDKTYLHPGINGRYLQEFNISAGVFNIKILKVRRGDNGPYQCQILPSTTPNFKLINLEVQIPVKILEITPSYPPHFNITYFNESETANLTCITDGTEPITILWVREPLGCNSCQNCVIPNGYKPKFDDDEPERKYLKKSLIIPNISRENSTCFGVKAENLDSHNQWRLIDVVVKFKPRIKAVNADVRGGPGGYLTLKCNVEALPGATVIWRTPTTNETEDEDLTNGTSKHIITTLNPSTDFGNYTCEASNVLGTVTSWIEVNGRPVAPTVTSPNTSRRKHAYELCWTKGEGIKDSNINDIPIREYVIEYRGEWVEVLSDGSKRVLFSHDIPLTTVVKVEFEKKYYCETLRDLRPSTNYTIAVYGKNDYGTGNRTTYRICTVNADIPTTTPKIVTPNATLPSKGDPDESRAGSLARKSASSYFYVLLVLLQIWYYLHSK